LSPQLMHFCRSSNSLILFCRCNVSRMSGSVRASEMKLAALSDFHAACCHVCRSSYSLTSKYRRISNHDRRDYRAVFEVAVPWLLDYPRTDPAFSPSTNRVRRGWRGSRTFLLRSLAWNAPRTKRGFILLPLVMFPLVCLF
jgi:hypothetical protein